MFCNNKFLVVYGRKIRYRQRKNLICYFEKRANFVIRNLS